MGLFGIKDQSLLSMQQEARILEICLSDKEKKEVDQEVKEKMRK